MARYIDADELEELFREVIGAIAKRPEIMNGNLEHMVRASAMVIEMIKDAPTADVQEVRHGKWLVIENDEDELWQGGGHYECTACGYGFSFGGFFEMNTLPYCPHCGAKMEVPDEEPT